MRPTCLEMRFSLELARPPLAMTWDDSLGNLCTLDAWRSEIGLVYNAECFEHFPKTTVAGRPLRTDLSDSVEALGLDGLRKNPPC